MPAAGEQGGPLLAVQLRRVSRHFGAVTALHEVDLEIRPGEIVGLVGDNGAGKSTLVRILSGADRPSSGEVLVDGSRAEFRSPSDARRLGIETVYQDLALALDLDVAANVFLGREEVVRGPLGWLGWLDDRRMAARADALMDDLRISVGSSGTDCRRLSGGQRQAVAVARAVNWGTRLVLMDEPTAALGIRQQHQVGELVRGVNARGVAVLLISHNLPQVFDLCQRIVVLAHGRVAATLPRESTSVEDVVGWITGAHAADRGPAR